MSDSALNEKSLGTDGEAASILPASPCSRSIGNGVFAQTSTHASAVVKYFCMGERRCKISEGIKDEVRRRGENFRHLPNGR
jgi:hypothetical protein